jgi:phage gpG-like protein
VAGKFTWNGPKFLAMLRAEMKRRVSACTIAVQNRAKELLNVDGADPPAKPKGRMNYGARRSKPGEPPYKQTGRLQSSVAHEVQDTGMGPVGRVGTNLPYGRALELGAKATRSKIFGKPTRPYLWVLLARPWLRRALKDMRGFIRAVLGRPMRF